MNKRIKKKKIPHGTYCHGRLVRNNTGGVDAPEMCPFWKYLGMTILHRDIAKADTIAKAYTDATGKLCPHRATCTEPCWQTPKTQCKIRNVQCTYVHVIDTTEDTLLWDQCKICGIKDEW